MTNPSIIAVSDIVEGNGKTWRENNLAKEHKIAIGRLVECISSGMRLWVWGHSRDCDGTPLYHLTLDRDLIGVEVSSSFPEDFAEKAAANACIFSGIAPRYEDQLVAAKCFLALQHGEKVGKIIWNAGGDDSFRVVDTVIVDEAKEREMYEQMVPLDRRDRYENGNYIHAPTQDIWEGWLKRAEHKEFTTLDSELWKSPFIDINERLEIADGAIAWRNEVIANLRRQLVDARKTEQVETVVIEPNLIDDVDSVMDVDHTGSTNLLEEFFLLTKEEGAVMPTVEEIKSELATHIFSDLFNEDGKLILMMADLEDEVTTNEFHHRLAYRAPLRRALEICKEQGVRVTVDLSLAKG